MRHPGPGLTLALWLATACSGAGEPGPEGASDADTPFSFDHDAGLVGELRIGRCEVPATGLDCTGHADEAQQYRPLAEGDTLRIVHGPQGSFMLVVLLRAEGLDGGDPQQPASPDNPSVQVLLRDPLSDAILTRYRGRVAFGHVPGTSDLFQSSAAIFVVVDGQERSLVGNHVRMEALLEDRLGARRRGVLGVQLER